MSNWKVISERLIFADSPHIELLAQEIELPSGRIVQNYYQLNSRPSMAVAAWTVDQRLVMLRQYKHGARRESLTFPGGRREAGEGLIETGKRELMEETGYVSEHWTCFGEFNIHANQHMGVVGLFSARNAIKTVEPSPGDLEDMEVVLVSPAEARCALATGEINMLGDVALLSMALGEAVHFE
jgi:ADP-ribose pyrophosphatase